MTVSKRPQNRQGPVRRKHAGTTGVKLLLAAASVSATMGGWAVLSSHSEGAANTPAAAQAEPAALVAAAAPAFDQAWSAPQIAALPTLVPLPRDLALAPGGGSSNVVVAPTPTSAPAPLMRSVQAPRPAARPPAPITVTRSSR